MIDRDGNTQQCCCNGGCSRLHMVMSAQCRSFLLWNTWIVMAHLAWNSSEQMCQVVARYARPFNSSGNPQESERNTLGLSSTSTSSARMAGGQLKLYCNLAHVFLRSCHLWSLRCMMPRLSYLSISVRYYSGVMDDQWRPCSRVNRF